MKVTEKIDSKSDDLLDTDIQENNKKVSRSLLHYWNTGERHKLYHLCQNYISKRKVIDWEEIRRNINIPNLEISKYKSQYYDLAKRPTSKFKCSYDLNSCPELLKSKIVVGRPKKSIDKKTFKTLDLDYRSIIEMMNTKTNTDKIEEVPSDSITLSSDLNVSEILLQNESLYAPETICEDIPEKDDEKLSEKEYERVIRKIHYNFDLVIDAIGSYRYKTLVDKV